MDNLTLMSTNLRNDGRELPPTFPQQSVADLVQKHLGGACTLLGCEPYLVRYKGEDGAVVAYRVRFIASDGERATYVTARTGALWRLRSQWERFRRIDPSVCSPLQPGYLDEDRRVLLLSFPLDRRLPRIAPLLDIRKVRRLLRQEGVVPQNSGWRVQKHRSTVTIASFRPERRVVLHWRIALKNDTSRDRQRRGFFFRLHAQARNDQAIDLRNRLYEEGFPTPPILARPQTNMMIEGEVAGEPMRLFKADAAARLEEAGRLLAKLHAIPPPPSGTASDPKMVFERAEACCRNLGRLDVVLMNEAFLRLERVRTAPPTSSRVIVHGDCHSNQFVVGPSGLSLVDWDRVRLGHPAEDLASLTAHLALEQPDLLLLGRRAIQKGYTSFAPLPHADELRWFEAIALLCLADMPFRRVLPYWRERVRLLLCQLDLLAETGR